MKIAVGVDIEENARFENKVSDSHFLDRIFTEKEKEYCLSKGIPSQHLAARFCAKEAVIKALCSFFEETVSVDFKKIEIVKNSEIPQIKIHDERFEDLDFSVSISHCKTYSVAQVVCWKR